MPITVKTTFINHNTRGFFPSVSPLQANMNVSLLRSPIQDLTLRLLMSYIYIYIYIYIYMERLLLMFLDHTQRRNTVGRTPLDE